MTTEPGKKPSPWLIWAAAIATAYGAWQLLVPGAEPDSWGLFAMNLIATGLGAAFLIVTYLRRNQ